MRIRKKKYQEENVYEAALNRIRYCYDRFDKVVVSFSGGKDSTAVLNLTLKIAKEKNRLPLEVVFFDEEIIAPLTDEYVKRVSEHPDIDFKWYCLEIQHRNACSNEEPFWWCWDKNKKDLWCRELPNKAITYHKNFVKGNTIPDISPKLYDKKDGSIAMLTGIRTEESLRRYQVIASKEKDSYIQASSNNTNQYTAHPIYDWSSEDVWLAVTKFDWDYNRNYDLMNQTRIFEQYLKQRVCPPFGEEPLRGLWQYVEMYPELYNKMLNRVSGVGTATRYANTDLYTAPKTKPEGITWKEYVNIILESYNELTINQVKQTLNGYMKQHANLTNNQIPDEEPHPLTGLSWKVLAQIANRGDFKGRQQSTIIGHRVRAQEKLGITQSEAQKIYGK